MENIILPCKSRPPVPFPSKKEANPSEFAPKTIKTSLSFTKTKQFSSSSSSSSSSSRLNSGVTDTHLNFLCNNGRLSEAVIALDAVAKRGSKVRSDTYIQLLQSCIDSDSIQLGRKIHAQIGLVDEVDLFVETKLVGMYAKCGCLEDARKVFDVMRDRNLYTWSAMIGACAREQRWREVVQLFSSMMGDGFVPDGFLFPKILQACGNSGDLETGKLIHSFVIRSGMSCYERVNNSILAVYAKCGELSLARKFFDNMDCRDRVAWNSVISGYCKRGKIEEAQRFFDAMQEEGIEPGVITWNILIASYCQSGNCDAAMELMNKMKSFGTTPDVFTWTSMISGLARSNNSIHALELFREMVLVGVEPSGVTITTAISACASLKALCKGKEIHSIAVKIGSIRDVLVGNSLIDMYSKCSELEAARRVFDMVSERDVYTWNSMIGGYCQSGYCGKAYDLFMKMQDSDLRPNVVTWNVMISGYMQSGDEDQAMDLFQKMEKDGIERDTATWNSLIAGYVQNGQKNKALELFRQMQLFSLMPNSVTILSIIPACANLVAAKKVKEIHGCVLRSNLGSELSVANALIDAYAKSGRLDYSQIIFDGTPSKDIITWNSLISGYSLHGSSYTALNLYDQMKMVGLKPNRGTFMSIIFAYSLGRMVDEGKQVFSSMIEDYQISPGLEHYAAMVNLLGRSGRLGEAIEFIENMAIEPDFSVWDALITACRIHGNVDLENRVRERLLELKPGSISKNHSNLQAYALYGNSEDTLKVRNSEMNETKKFLVRSWIEIKNTVHTFVADDCSKPYSDFLYSWIQSIAGKVKPPEPHCGLCIEEEEEEIGGVHSEKLALAFTLIGSTCQPKTIRIVKNLRMCGDCHRTAKFITTMYGCEIYLNDSKCFHHFKNGHCSCGDYW